MRYNEKVISTFAKNMLCPPSLFNGEVKDLGVQGIKDFESYKYRHIPGLYQGDSLPSEDELIEKIKNSLATFMGSKKKPLVLLSDGKDSMALAVAFSELKISCETLTLLRKEDDDLRGYIESVALALGHKPYFVTIDEILDSYDEKTFLKACSKARTPVLDQAFFFFLFGVKVFFCQYVKDPSNYILIDGLGNDEYLGYLPSKNQLSSYKLSRLGLWKLIPEMARGLRWYIRSPSESHGDLSALACIFPIPGSFDLNEYFSRIPHSSEPLPFVDFRAFSRGSFHDHQCMMGKTIATAKAFNAEVYFPWLHPALAAYCFNYPYEKKFDFAAGVNKIPLRALLKRKINWNQEKRGIDLYFDLDMPLVKEKIISTIVPDRLTNKIEKSLMLPDYVKKRALLELLNFYGYCKSQGYEDCEIERILMG
jgi:asparagine synthetase B (glutamine-hydrolysing)